MITGWLRAGTVVALSCLALLALLLLLGPGKTGVISGAELVSEVSLCDDPDCTTSRPVSLPLLMNNRGQPGGQQATVQARVPVPPDQSRPLALFFPKLSDAIQITVDGTPVYAAPANARLWNTPLLVPLPALAPDPGEIMLEMTLTSPVGARLDLYPFHLGPRDRLAPSHAWRNFVGPGIARFAVGLVTTLAVCFMVLWLYRRTETAYLWLGLACIVALPSLVHFGYSAPFDFLGGSLWTKIWTFSIPVFVLLFMMFLQRFLNLDLAVFVRIQTGMTCLGAIIMSLAPPELAFDFGMWANVAITVPFSFMAIILLWNFRSMVAVVDFWVLYVCFSIAAMLGLYELHLQMAAAPIRSVHLFQWMPVAMSLVCLWLILSRLLHSLREYETLNRSLTRRIDEKTAELEESFAQMADIRRRETLERERRRIMQDLHDGIGGQLVNALAYMERNRTGDAVLQQSLEDALRDLAMILDSMDNHDSFPTLLGMLRGRLEGLLGDHGLAFDWQVHGDPTPANAGPSEALNLARIVQEAITNVVKHAQADTINVFVDDRRIRISDNGRGFDPAAQEDGKPANGLGNMRRRSVALGAEFLIDSSPRGTTIELLL